MLVKPAASIPGKMCEHVSECFLSQKIFKFEIYCVWMNRILGRTFSCIKLVKMKSQNPTKFLLESFNPVPANFNWTHPLESKSIHKSLTRSRHPCHQRATPILHAECQSGGLGNTFHFGKGKSITSNLPSANSSSSSQSINPTSTARRKIFVSFT